MKLKAVVEKGQENKSVHPLYDQMDAYGWLIVKLIPLFGKDRIVLAEADMGHALGIYVSNRKEGSELKRHAIWLERDTEKGHFSLNGLPEEKRDTLARHFIQDAKYALWGTV